MQNCIMVALASWGSLTGTLDELADRLGMPTEDFRMCVRQLSGDRLIAVQTAPGGYLTIRVERRATEGLRAGRDRRRYRSQAWRL